MNILVVSISAPPKNSPESLQTGRYLLELSKIYDTSLLTTIPAPGWAPAEEKLKTYLNFVDQVLVLPTLPGLLLGGIKRIAPKLMVPDEQFIFHWLSAFVKLKKIPDLLFSRSTPFSSAVMAYKLKRKFSIPWVMHLSDTWVDNPFYRSISGKSRLDSYWEYKCFRLADVVTVTSELTLRFYASKYPQYSRKLRQLPNVIESSSINKNEVSVEGKIRFVFTGRLYGSRSPEALLNAIQTSLELRPEFKEVSEFIFAGFFDPQYEEQFNKLDLKNVKNIGHVSQEESIKLQRSAHILMLIDSLEDDDRHDLFFPSKVLEYIAARRRVLAITRSTSTVNSIIGKELGDCFSAEMLGDLPQFIIHCIEKFKGGDVSYFSCRGDFTEYTVENQTKKLVKIFEELISR
ncbi:MAG TPA: hypothetical protein PK185_00635 [Cyclobacteriaceae bacterium]|nr:hypothetical protein [Cyclobacteriaceae bacterium]